MIRQPTVLAGLGLALVAGLLAAAYLAFPPSVHIVVDGETRTVRTRARSVAAALQAAGVALDPADQVEPQLEAPVGPGQAITITRALPVSLWAGGQLSVGRSQPLPAAHRLAAAGAPIGPAGVVWADGALLAGAGENARHLALQPAITVTVAEEGSGRSPLEVNTAARTVGEALAELGYELFQADAITPGLDSPLQPGLAITLERSLPVLVTVDGVLVAGRTRAATVGEALADAGVALLGDDYTVPAEAEPLPVGGQVRVVRVTRAIVTEQHLIPYETVYQPLPEAEIDTLQTVQAGQPGVLRRLTRVRLEDGVEVSRVPEDEVLVQAAANHIIGYGTNIVVRTLDTPDGPIEYWRAYTMYATSYAAKFTDREPGSPNYGRTASGKIVTKGLVAIDRSMMPFGTRMYVPGYGFAEAADTGGGVRGRFIDLGFDDWNYENWHRVVTVYFLTPVPPAGSIRWVIPSTVP